MLYNGSEAAPDRQELKLSDAFEHKIKGYEWTATFLNINTGHNKEILTNCPALNGYAKLISYIREHTEAGLGQEDAVEKAINQCINEGYLAEYLRENIGEAKGMLLSGFDQEIYDKGRREEGREEKERQIIQKLLSKNKSPEEISELLDIDISLVKEVQSL